jgi:periplasmic copper chaperone A
MRSLKALTLSGVLLLAAVPLGAHEYASRDVTVAHPWARATPGGAKVGSVYLEMKAKRGPGDRLVAVRSPIAGSAEIHSHVMEQGIAKMRRLDGIPMPGGKSIILRPDGFHIMLIDLKEPLKEGDLTKVTLIFEKAGEIEVDATVEPIGATGPHGFKGQPPGQDGGKGHHH